MAASILAQRDRISLDNGFDLRLLSALEVVQARREAEELTEHDGERELWVNACLLARALEKAEDETPVFSGGREVMAALTAEEIAVLADRWSAFSRESVPRLEDGPEERPEGETPPPERQEEPESSRAEGEKEDEKPASPSPEAAREEQPEERRQSPEEGPEERRQLPEEVPEERPAPAEAPVEEPAAEGGRPVEEPALFPPEAERGQGEGESFPLPLRPAAQGEISAPASSGPGSGQIEVRLPVRGMDEQSWAERADRIFRRDSRRYDGGFYLY